MAADYKASLNSNVQRDLMKLVSSKSDNMTHSDQWSLPKLELYMRTDSSIRRLQAFRKH